MIRRQLAVVVALMLLAGCGGGETARSVPTASSSEESARTTVRGTVAGVALSARLVVLSAPVDGVGIVVLEESGRVLSAAGDEIGLQALEVGQTIVATGRLGTGDALIANIIQVGGAGESMRREEPTESSPDVSPERPSEAPPETVSPSLPQEIGLEAPRFGEVISSPLEVRGWVGTVPDGGTVRVRVYDGQGRRIGEAALTVRGEPGQAGTFNGHVVFDAPSSGGGTLEVADVRPSDGSIAARVQVQVSFGGTPSITLTGVVMALFTDPPLITLEEPVQGFSFVALTEDTRLAFLNGAQATLQDIEPGATVWASGYREGADTLVAREIVLLEEGAPPPTEEMREIVLDAPQEGDTVHSRFELRGRVSVAPFEGTLVARVIDASGRLLAEEPFIVDGEMGEPASFVAYIEYRAPEGGPGQVEVVEISPRDGSIVASARVNVILTEEQRGIVLESPKEGDTVTSPIELRGRASVTPFEATLVARVIDATGQLLAEEPFMVDGEIGGPASFVAHIAYGASEDGPGQVEVVEISPRDGSTVASARVDVMLTAVSEFMIVGRVASVFPHARIIDLVDPVEGYELVAVVDETVVLSSDGAEIALEEIEPGMKIEVSGRPGASGTLIATQVRVLP